MKILAADFSGTYDSFGMESYIYYGTHGLTLGSENEIALVNRQDNNLMVRCIPNGASLLYHDGHQKLETSTDGIIVNGVMHGTASESFYADLAEKYIIKGEVNPGNVILISRDDSFDGEISNEIGANNILGVISENPGFKMNSELTDGVYIALRGRIKCLVQGPVQKGEPLITGLNGTAISYKKLENNLFGCLLGRTNEKIETDQIKLIEIII